MEKQKTNSVSQFPFGGFSKTFSQGCLWKRVCLEREKRVEG